MLTKLSQEHKIVVSCMCSDHPRMTTSGFVSNHTYGRGLDIASIDGEIVGPGSALAREVASELSEFPASIRGDEIGSPFAISGPGYFTDAAHQNHIHVGFKTEITPDWEPPPASRPTRPPQRGAAASARRSRRARRGRGPGGRRRRGGRGAARGTDPKRGSGLFAAIAPPGRREGRVRGRQRLGAVRGARPQGRAAGAGRGDPRAAAGRRGAGRAGRPDRAGRARVDLGAVGDAYPGDDATKEELAAWMGKQAEKRGLPPQLPVMASLVESGLKNLNFGDADSVGFFQMRVSIWNQGDYAGYADDPKKQVDWFLDTAEQVKNQRLARGQSVTDPKQFGEWIADVERPAAQYRYRYQLQLDEANGPPEGRARRPAGPGGRRRQRRRRVAGGAAAAPRSSSRRRGAAGRAGAGQARADRSPTSSVRRVPGPAGSPTPKRSRSSRTRTSPSTTSGSPTSKPGGSTRGSSPC